METYGTAYLGVELKYYYYNEFILCGIPVPPFTRDAGFVLKFHNPEHYKSYTNILKTILSELELVDPEDRKYEVLRSKAFIKNLLLIMRDQFTKKYN